MAAGQRRRGPPKHKELPYVPKRFLGRGLANAYAVLGIVLSMGFAVFATMRFNMLMDIFYPMLMLFIVNFTFKDDLVR